LLEERRCRNKDKVADEGRLTDANISDEEDGAPAEAIGQEFW
jgi:hypothetical protein